MIGNTSSECYLILQKIPVRNIKSGELTDAQKLEIQEAKK